jgi:hypothetical protein
VYRQAHFLKSRPADQVMAPKSCSANASIEFVA